VWLAIAFAIGTALTTVDAAGAPVLQWLVAPGQTQLGQQDWADAAPYVCATLALLGMGATLACACKRVWFGSEEGYEAAWGGEGGDGLLHACSRPSLNGFLHNMSHRDHVASFCVAKLIQESE
jgi:hypothetical protein